MLRRFEYQAPGQIARYVAEHGDLNGCFADIGCGTGLVGVALRSGGFTGELHGLDLSVESLRLAEERAIYVSLDTADLQQPLRFEDDSYDGLVCVGVMSYLPEVEAVWREFARVVKPDGLIAISQRSDHWVNRDCEAIAKSMDSDVWELLEITERMPYLPGDPDHSNELEVHYVVAKAC